MPALNTFEIGGAEFALRSGRDRRHPRINFDQLSLGAGSPPVEATMHDERHFLVAASVARRFDGSPPVWKGGSIPFSVKTSCNMLTSDLLVGQRMA
jgi:hypothetical protein